MGIRRVDLLVPVKEMHDAGMSVRAIASATYALGVPASPTTVLKILHHLNPPNDQGMIRASVGFGLDGKTRLNRRVDTTERDTRIRDLRSGGKSMRAIAAEVGCSVGTVHRIIRP
jgi:hypothetical protein